MKKIIEFLNKYVPRIDRLEHSFYGTAIFIVILFLSRVFSFSEFTPLIAVCIVAFFKEVYDYFKQNSTGFDIIDFLFTVLYPTILTFLIF